LRERLRAALDGADTLERELGGAGMSRVFVAEDARLGRRVVVKVLGPELTEGVSAERFAREVRVAARLQHPNVVPVLRRPSSRSHADGSPARRGSTPGSGFRRTGSRQSFLRRRWHRVLLPPTGSSR